MQLDRNEYLWRCESPGSGCVDGRAASLSRDNEAIAYIGYHALKLSRLDRHVNTNEMSVSMRWSNVVFVKYHGRRIHMNYKIISEQNQMKIKDKPE